MCPPWLKCNPRRHLSAVWLYQSRQTEDFPLRLSLYWKALCRDGQYGAQNVNNQDRQSKISRSFLFDLHRRRALALGCTCSHFTRAACDWDETGFFANRIQRNRHSLLRA